MKSNSVRCTLTALALMAASWAHAAEDQALQQPPLSASAQASTADASAMTDGEVRRVDAANKKITLKHGEIKNLEMPPMTMVFQVEDASALEKLKVGDKVRFAAEKRAGALVVTRIEAAK